MMNLKGWPAARYPTSGRCALRPSATEFHENHTRDPRQKAKARKNSSSWPSPTPDSVVGLQPACSSVNCIYD